MNKKRNFSLILLTWILILSCMPFTLANTPNYVGIQNNQSFTWNTTYDEDTLQDGYEDTFEELGWSDSAIEAYLDTFDMDEDLIQLKIVVLDVEDEETDPWGEDGVRIIYNVYVKEEEGEWEIQSEDETFAIWDYDKDIYTDDELDFVGPFEDAMGFFDFDWKSDYDDDDMEWERFKYLKGENPWFISSKADWDEIEEELEEYYEDDEDYDEVDIDLLDDKPGIQVELDEDDDDDLEPFGYIIEYDDNGVLMYYEAQYDGDPYIIVEREGKFFYDYALWIVIGIIAAVAIIVIIIVIIKRR